MSDYPMLISNKLHSFRNFVKQNYNLKVSSIKLFTNMESHLLQMRGLKRVMRRYTYMTISRIFYRCVD